jgi:hypothetical protein
MQCTEKDRLGMVFSINKILLNNLLLYFIIALKNIKNITANQKHPYTTHTLECKGGLQEAPDPVILSYTPYYPLTLL